MAKVARHQRTAFTLFEMVVVLLLIVVASSLAMPLVDSMLHPNQLSAATDSVFANWEQSRNRAMEEGRPYRFSIKENGREFKIEPDDADSNPEKGFTIEGALPETCLFVSNGTGIIEASARPESSGTWKTVAVFLPDGTAREDATLCFGRPGLARVTLKLRAHTGQVSQVREKTT